MYRGSSRDFYNDGTYDEHIPNFPTHRSPGVNVVNDRPMDVFKVRRFLDNLTFQAVMGPLEDSIASGNGDVFFPRYTKFSHHRDGPPTLFFKNDDVLIFKHAKDKHATLIICIMGTEEPKLPIAFYTVDSGTTDDFSKRIAARLNGKESEFYVSEKYRDDLLPRITALQWNFVR